MLFDEEKAKDIVEKYGLSKNKIAVWRSNNNIPNKYNKKEYSIYSDMANKQIPIIRKQMFKIMEARKLKLVVVNDICGFPKNKLSREIQKKGVLKYDEYIRLIESMNSIKRQTEKALEALKSKNKNCLDNYFNNEMLNLMALFENNLIIYTKITQSRKNARKAFPFEYTNDIERCLFTLLLELKLIIIYLYYQAEFSTL